MIHYPAPPSPSTPATEHPPRELSSDEWKAFGRGYEFSFDAAMRLARRIGAVDMAEDLVSEAKVKMVDALTQMTHPVPFPSSDERFRGLLLTMVRRVAVDEHRRWDPLDCLGLEHADEALAPEEDHEAYEAVESLVLEGVMKLPEMQIFAFMYTHWHGMSRGEAAQRLGISVKTYDSHLGLALERLRRHVVEAAPMDTALSDEVKAFIAGLERRRTQRVDGRRAKKGGHEVAA